MASFVKTEESYRDKGPCWLCSKVKPKENKHGGYWLSYPTCRDSDFEEVHIHRRLYAQKFGSIKGLALTRVCTTETCVNPDHFFVGSANARTTAGSQN